MASKFEHMGYIGVAVINDPERAGRTLTRVFTSPNPPKDYLKQRAHTGSEEWTLIFDDLIPNVDGKFGLLEFLNTNQALKDLSYNTGNSTRVSTDAYFRGNPNDIISFVKSSIKASNDALIRHQSVLATQEQLENDIDFQKFAKEKIQNSSENGELLFSGNSIKDTKIIDTIRVLKESKWPLTLAAITKSIHGKGKEDYTTQEEKERTKDILNILTHTGFLQINHNEQQNTSRFSAYPAFKIAQLKLLAQSMPMLNVVGQLGHLFDPNIKRPNEQTPYLNDPELEKNERIARINDKVNDQYNIYLKSESFKKEKDNEFKQVVINLIDDMSVKMDIATLEEARREFDKFSEQKKALHKKIFLENIKDILTFRKNKIRQSLTESSVLKPFDSADVDRAKREGDFNLLEAEKAGYVYILYNKENHIFKVGETSRNPQGRANELSANQDMPSGWILARNKNFEGYVFTEDRQLLEALMHSRFKSERFNQKREFFRSLSQTDDSFFETLSNEVTTAKSAVREYHHTQKTSYPFIKLAQEELESRAKNEQYRIWKEEKEKREEAEFFKSAENTINNRNIEPIKNGVTNPNYDNPLFVPILQIIHYNSGRKDMSNNLRTNPRTRDELKEQLNMYFPELNEKIKNENIQNALDLIRTIEPPIIKETIRTNSQDTQIRFMVSSLNEELIDTLDKQLPKLSLKEKVGYMLNESIPQEVEKRFLVTVKTPILLGALKVDKTNKSLAELSNELGLFDETVKDIMEGLQKELKQNNVYGHARAIFVVRADKDGSKPELYGGNLKFTKAHIEELDSRYPDVGFDNIKMLYGDDNPKELHSRSNKQHLEIRVPMPVVEPELMPEVFPEIPEIPVSAYDDVPYMMDENNGDDWLHNIPDYPNPISDEELFHKQMEQVPLPEVENDYVEEQYSEKDVSVEIIKLLKITGSPALQNKEKRSSKKTLSPEEISQELNINVNIINKVLEKFESLEMNPLHVRDFGDRKTYGMNYKIEQEDLMRLDIFDNKNIEHRKVLSLFNNTNPNNFYSPKKDDEMTKNITKVKNDAEKFDVADKYCPQALREIENMMPSEILDQLRKIATKDPQAILEWLKEEKTNSSSKNMPKM